MSTSESNPKDRTPSPAGSRSRVFQAEEASIVGMVPWLVEELQRRLIEVAPRCEVRVLRVEPANGAVAIAIAEAHGEARLPRYLQT